MAILGGIDSPIDNNGIQQHNSLGGFESWTGPPLSKRTSFNIVEVKIETRDLKNCDTTTSNQLHIERRNIFALLNFSLDLDFFLIV